MISYIVAIGWMYVVLMMSITETSFVAGIMTFFAYGVFPLSIILYLTGTRVRRKKRQTREKENFTLAQKNSQPEPDQDKNPQDDIDRK